MKIAILGMLFLGCAAAVQASGSGPDPVTLHLKNERLDRTRITVLTREGAVLVRRRMGPLDSEVVTVRVGNDGLRIVAHDEGFNRFLDEDYLIRAQAGEHYSVTVTMMDAIAILPYRERKQSPDGTKVKLPQVLIAGTGF